MAELLVDTDVFVDHLRGTRELSIGSRDRVSYSVITRCELFAGTRDDEEHLRLLLAPFRELPVDRLVAETAGRVRRQTGIRTPDALIAATALSAKLTLLTGNKCDFERVGGLKVRSPS